MSSPVIQSIHQGRPKAICDARGEWVSSIARQRADGPVRVLYDGLEDDKVAQPYHGGPDGAVCVHLSDHYRFWNDRYGMALREGGLGENLVLDGISEDQINIGDTIQIGNTLVQVSGPRVPCANQARHVGRADWVRLTIRENRTGFYLRVIRKGTISTGDLWDLRERRNESGSIAAVNNCFYLDFVPALAEEFAELEGFAEWWKQQFREKLKARGEHWSNSISQ